MIFTFTFKYVSSASFAWFSDLYTSHIVVYGSFLLVVWFAFVTPGGFYVVYKGLYVSMGIAVASIIINVFSVFTLPSSYLRIIVLYFLPSLSCLISKSLAFSCTNRLVIVIICFKMFCNCVLMTPFYYNDVVDMLIRGSFACSSWSCTTTFAPWNPLFIVVAFWWHLTFCCAFMK